MVGMEVGGLSPAQATLPYPFLDQHEGYALSVRNYILIATVGIWGWDFILSLPRDHKMKLIHNITPPSIAYTNSRLWTMVALIYSTVYSAYPLGNCRYHDLAIEIVTTLATACCTLLVLLRVRATFYGSHLGMVYVAFWLTHVTLTVVANFAVDKEAAGPIGETKFCKPSGVNLIHTVSAAFLCFYNAVVFIGISLRLGMIISVEPGQGRSRSRSLRFTVLGEGLPPFTKGMLRDGQKYYVVTLLAGSMSAIMTAVFRRSPYYSTLFHLPSVAIINIMACRVYRNTKLEGYKDTSTSGSISAPLSRLTFSFNPDTTKGSVSVDPPSHSTGRT